MSNSTAAWSRKRVLTVSAAVAAVAGSVAAGTALAAGPTLPPITAQQLLVHAMNSNVQTFSGTVESSVDLGVPSQLLNALPSAAASAAGAAGVPSGQQSGGSGQSSEFGQGKVAQQELLSLLSGTSTAQVAKDGDTKQSFTASNSGRTVEVVRNGSDAWAYDSQGNQVTHWTGVGQGEKSQAPDASSSAATPQDATKLLDQITPYSNVTVSGSSEVAGRQVYTLQITPKGTGSTIGLVDISVDAKTYLPLEVKVLPADGSDAIADIRFANISYGTPAASAFQFSTPAGAKVTTKNAQTADHGQAGTMHGKADHGVPTAPTQQSQKPGANGETVLGSGWQTVWKINPQQAANKNGKSGQGALSALGALKEVGKPVNGGTLFSTKVVNVLLTPNGTVYAGAVTPSYLENLAGQ
ncbi:LolA family protein [Streptacidiphilus fuscans]|uniref:Outer membrane lipoprotein carrier protein LolA n=1 Tax=Streptacidiphilus fuscans TaxID=2789292 RepID=A0A931B0K3_9ACTN|nr:outer-membrane lipoprotein carrier protein LolA [Streptacidiphilus fuscans]MBF9068023.1 outer membrane lipoprotein carrier protein LolA [Streptacidiphilus fuscans]